MYYNQEDLSPSEDVTTDITNDLDEIEVISTQIIRLETPVSSCLQIHSTSESREKERRGKRINRIVAFCATCIFITCIALVCSTLMMSKNIDELGEYVGIIIFSNIFNNLTKKAETTISLFYNPFFFLSILFYIGICTTFVFINIYLRCFYSRH